MNMFQGDTAAIEALVNDQQCKRLLRLRFPKNDGPAQATMLANTLIASESLARDFVYSIEVLADSATIHQDDVLGKMVAIELVREDGTLRYFNGYVFEFRLVKTDGGFAFYEMVLGPWLSYLKLRHDNVAFHSMSVRDLTDKVCEQYIKRDWRHRIAGDDPAITYSCQHNESDHNFLHRHWESLGWFYTYEHRADGHTLVLSDDSRRTAVAIEGARTDMPFQHHAGAIEDDGIHQWSAARRIASDQMTLVSFNFKHPRPKRVERRSAQGKSAEPQLEVYENVGTYGFKDFTDGDALAQLRIEELDSRRSEFVGTGNDRTAEPGRWFTLSGHFASRGNARDIVADQKYLITSVQHKASNNYQDGRGAISSYTNEIVCIPQDLPWRPGRHFNSVEPKIYGVQTAVVVGPAGEEIHTDGYGRVKVQFHWDRKGEFNEKSSPWVRVVSSWAGAQFGQISLPRVGMEVVIQFLDGNIDHPLIIGCVYNANNMPPWGLPENKTQSGMLTRSSKGGRSAHANALRFEDKRGAEELWLHAEKDQRIEVEHDESHWVGNDRKKKVDRDENTEVKHDRTETVGHDENITIHNNRVERVDKNESISIGDNRTERVGGNEKIQIDRNKNEIVRMAKTETIGLANLLSVGALYQTTVGGAMNTTVAMSSSEQVGLYKTVNVGSEYVLRAEKHITLGVGTSRITISPNAIYLEADNIHIRGNEHIHADAPADINLNSGTAKSAPSVDLPKEKYANED